MQSFRSLKEGEDTVSVKRLRVVKANGEESVADLNIWGPTETSVVNELEKSILDEGQPVKILSEETYHPQK